MIYPPSIGQTGGCNPVPLPSKVEGGDLVLAAADLAAGAHLFTPARDPRRARRLSGTEPMYARLLIESLRRGTRRKLLAVSAVALGTLGATALGEVVLASGDRLAAEMGSYGANLVMTPAREGETLPVADLAKVRRIFWKNNIVAVAPTLDLRVRMAAGHAAEEDRGAARRHLVRSPPGAGVPDRPAADPADAGGRGTLAAREGPRGRPRWRSAAGSPSGWACGRGATSGWAWAIAARASGWSGSSPAAARRTTRPSRRSPAVERLSGLPGRFTRAEIFALTVPELRNTHPDPRRESQGVRDLVLHRLPLLDRPAAQRGPAGRRGRASTTASPRPRRTCWGGCAGCSPRWPRWPSPGAAVGVTAAMTATVIERRLEAGLLVAIGAPRGRVVLFFLSEAALLGLFGGVAGGGLGLVAGRLLGSGALGVTVPWMPILLPFAALLGLAVAVVASAAPVARALERYPADILKRATA